MPYQVLHSMVGALHTTISISLTDRLGANTLGYYEHYKITAVKGFTKLDREVMTERAGLVWLTSLSEQVYFELF
jgi:hypothetical protein